MEIQENTSLRPYNTFGIDVKARHFATFKSTDELTQLLIVQAERQSSYSKTPPFILGGGSNILFTKDYDGLVLKNEIRGIQKLREDDESVYIRAGAGENWHAFVMHCIENNWAGIENLSLIPGNVGATPMQNIGAYGVEIREVFHELKAFHIRERTNYTFTLSDCRFGYRDSVFKGKYRDQFIILQVTYKLFKTPRFNTRYGAINQELERMGVKELSIKAISDAVVQIRSSKLPDPKVVGNAGSFFKNPEISSNRFSTLLTQFPSIVGYSLPNGNVKLAAGWLIEQCGWKGYRRGDAGCHASQALVLVNYGNATGAEINELSEEIRESVVEKFGVELEKEVNIF